MNPIARLEQTCARIVEGTFARVFPSALDPAQVGRKLVASMSATPSDVFLVRVHPEDFARFEDDRVFLESRWTALLREAVPPGRTERPHAILVADPDIVAGAVAIEALLDTQPLGLVLVMPSGERHAIRGELRIGRADDNDLVVGDARASRYHARINARDDGFDIEDCGSSNGTFVDGERVERARLAAGMTVTIGSTHLPVSADGA